MIGHRPHLRAPDAPRLGDAGRRAIMLAPIPAGVLAAFAVTLLACLAPTHLAAQGEGESESRGLVIGRVTRGEPAVAVPGAIVYIQGGSATALTDSAGVFRFSLPTGAWTLLAYDPEGSRYESPAGVFVTVQAGVAVRADIDLDASARGSATNPYVLDALEVVTRSTVIDDRLREGARFDILDSDYIRSRAPASRHVGDLIRGRFAGLRIREAGVGGPLCIVSRRAGPVGMGARGPCPGMVAVVIDGMKVLDPEFYLPLIPPDDIEEIRYLSGLMAGVAYGTDSENGVLLITTRSGGD